MKTINNNDNNNNYEKCGIYGTPFEPLVAKVPEPESVTKGY